MTATTLVAPSEGTRWVSPDALNVGDIVLVETVRMGGMGLPLLSSDDGYIHVVADVQELSRGWLRVKFETFEADGERRASALEGRPFYEWDRLYDLASSRPVGHKVACGCARCSTPVPMVEVVS